MSSRVVVLADTHLLTAPRPRGSLPQSALVHLREADVILHAGDLLDAGALDMLREYAPVHAVLGNNDGSLVKLLPPSRLVDLEGVRVGMVHDGGARAGRATRLRRRFPDADVVVFGHSHAPCSEVGDNGQLLFNPGSPTQRRAQPVRTLGVLCLGDAAVLRASIIPLY